MQDVEFYSSFLITRTFQLQRFYENFLRRICVKLQVIDRLKFLAPPSFAEEEEEKEEDLDSFLGDFLPRGGGEWEPPPTKGSRRATPTRGIRDIDDARRPISSRRRRATRRRCAPSSWFTCNASSKTRLTWPCCHSRGCATTSATCRLFTRGGVIIKGQPGGRLGPNYHSIGHGRCA